MNTTRMIALALAIGAVNLSAAYAQNLRNADIPAEFPPSSYRGMQYIDSRGCVYIRAGISGNVTWVPRVTRQRKHICGQKSTVIAASNSNGQKQAAANKPVQIRPAPANTASRVQPKPLPQKVATRVNGNAASRPAYSTNTQQNTRSSRSTPVYKPVASASTSAAAKNKATKAPVVASSAGISETARVLPKHLHDKRQHEQKTALPKGYNPLWEDDRLNPKRAEQTFQGIKQTNLLWTRTVPRRLIDKSSGRDLTAVLPLVYPYVDQKTQSRELGEVVIERKNGRVVKRVVRNRVPTSNTRQSTSRNSTEIPESNGSTAPGQGYVQIGTFSVKDNAQNAAARVKSMGYPVRINKYSRAGKSYRAVFVGPLGADSYSVLSKLRQSGYRDAILR